MERDSILINVGLKIKSIRNKNKITQIELSKACGLQKASLSRIESGKTNITLLTLKKISYALNAKMKDFF